MNRISVALTLLLVLSLGTMASAIVPTQLTVQGKLTDSAGDPLPPGTKTFVFRVFDASSGGAELWPGGLGESQFITTDAAGLWTANVGSQIPLPEAVFAASGTWLQITVNDGQALTTLPRTQLVTSPYAHRVATVDGASGGALMSGLDMPYNTSALNGNNAGFRWRQGMNAQSAFGLTVFNGVWFQGSWDALNKDFGIRFPTADGSLGSVATRLSHDGDITAVGNISCDGYLQTHYAAFAPEFYAYENPGEAILRLDNGGDLMWDNSVGTPVAVLTTHSDNNVYLDAAAAAGSNMIFRNHPNLYERMRINASGYVGIGVSNPDYQLTLPNIEDHRGWGVADGWFEYAQRSEKDIRPLEGALEKVERLQGVRYRKTSGGEEQIGLIAEDVGKVVPEVVAYDENGVDANAVNYARLTALLIEAVKEQQRQIEMLNRKLERVSP
jgi:energy-coupling factor transporter ATP-binding protein EcfA2